MEKPRYASNYFFATVEILRKCSPPREISQCEIREGVIIAASNSGFKQVFAHSSGKKHQDLAKGLFGSTQIYFSVTTSTAPDTAKPTTSKQERKGEITVDKSDKEAATQAELIWTMKVAASNFSYSSCGDTPQLFQTMFPCDTSRLFTLN